MTTHSFPETFFLKTEDGVEEAELDDDDDDETDERDADSKLESLEVKDGVGEAEMSFKREVEEEGNVGTES